MGEIFNEPLPIYYVNKGIGNNFGDRIELHKKLRNPEWKPLHDAILEHEMSHTSRTFSTKDLMLDTKSTEPRRMWKFILTTPSSWWQFLPLYKSPVNKKWALDINLCVIYALFTLGFIGIKWLFGKII